MSKAERTKQFIIEKTAPVFNAKGYAGTSINDLTEATGLTKGSIYGNFENKDEVALLAFDHNFGQVIALIRNKMDAKESTIDKLLVYPETYRNFLQLPVLHSGCPINNTAVESDDTHPLLKAKVANALEFWRERLESRIKIGIENNEIRPDVDINEFISVLISVIQGSVLQVKVTGKVGPLNAAMNFLEKLILDLKK
ncbi:TetR/AcrR family transcriptional regulator [Flavobacterium sp. CYK-4]|uniref:TetR/AcrR family transcriptional regulator n=1 Tax=Flavobacterium lotistagni TaxID=2709660 RepID=UPI00140CDAD8|nr:TetR/AcrR family transcriptional regulator [Flavobacterium lotistagni]NHM07211.1 TetR/AcrR family transcriptional regulator [Flavobacterium lotistagni]